MSKYAGRSTRRWKKLKAWFKAEATERELPCWLCGQPIAYDVHYMHPDAFSVDHMLPVSTHPEHAEDAANLRAAHRHCNIVRQNKEAKPSLGRQTRKW
ncbi:HNH endonuclease [Tomitella gaofuii]|uniref:HNH endonuclease n=1 Tax=Tomitella gaofuii TaxID=2760083 RepID=UPI0015FE3B7D